MRKKVSKVCMSCDVFDCSKTMALKRGENGFFVLNVEKEGRRDVFTV